MSVNLLSHLKVHAESEKAWKKCKLSFSILENLEKENNFPDLVGGHAFSYILFKTVIILLVSS